MYINRYENKIKNSIKTYAVFTFSNEYTHFRYFYNILKIYTVL